MSRLGPKLPGMDRAMMIEEDGVETDGLSGSPVDMAYIRWRKGLHELTVQVLVVVDESHWHPALWPPVLVEPMSAHS